MGEKTGKKGPSKRRKSVYVKQSAFLITPGSSLHAEVRELILSARQRIGQTVNAGLTLLYWQVGRRIRQDILKEDRAQYGAEIVSSLASQLESEFGRGFGEKSLRRMVQFVEVFPQQEIVVSLIRELTWTHFIALIPLKDPLQRDFYSEMCRVERWSVRMLRKKIDSMLYERTALSKKPKKLIDQELVALREDDHITPDLVFRDPYLLDFLGLKDTYAEKDLEAAILREMESFILELGVGFAFVARQKRIQVDSDDFYIDLLFFNRHLRRLIAIDLKLGDFKPADKGQMELYLRWLDKYERRSEENPPLGIILCAGKKQEQIELLELDKSGIHVAEYLTELPPREMMERKLHSAIDRARQRLVESKKGDSETQNSEKGQ
jgi:predicted nuclease of restriction endonuclease-like (RecB) superfamily